MKNPKARPNGKSSSLYSRENYYGSYINMFGKHGGVKNGKITNGNNLKTSFFMGYSRLKR